MPQTTIYTFTGTGNSLWAAERIAARIGDATIVPMADALTLQKPCDTVDAGFVFPVYFRGLPNLVARFLAEFAPAPGYHFAVSTHGGSPGDELARVAHQLEAKGGRLDYAAPLHAVGNYIAMYGRPSGWERRLDRMARDIEPIAEDIAEGHRRRAPRGFPPVNALSSRLHDRWAVSAAHRDERFAVSDACTRCGTCARACPADNIVQRADKPRFLHRCEQCMACIQRCPARAIDIPGQTERRERYVHPGASFDPMR